MKLLGIDYGRRRIGTALSDESGIAIRPLHLIDRLKDPSPETTIARLATEHGVAGVVAGLPLSPDDEETEMSREVRAFIETVRPLLPPAIDIFFTDESFSSVNAHRAMILHKKKKERTTKGTPDLMAACAIIDSFLREQESASW